MERYRDYDHFIDNRGIVYTTKGYHHIPNDLESTETPRIRASMIYLPTSFKTEKQNSTTGQHYARLIDDTGNVFCTRNIKEICYTDPITFDSFIAVPREDIFKRYGTLEKFDEIKSTFTKEHPIFEVLNNLRKVGIPETSIGFFGGVLVGMITNQSDIDLVIYGTENYQKWIDKYKEVFGDILIFPGMSRNRYRDFVGNFPFSFDEACLQFGKRHSPYKLKIGRVVFDIRFAYSEKEIPIAERHEPDSEIRFEGEIIETDKSAYCPAEYVVQIKQIKNSNRLKEGDSVRILTYRHHYRHLFKKGEKVKVFGMVTKSSQPIITLERQDFYIKDLNLIQE